MLTLINPHLFIYPFDLSFWLASNKSLNSFQISFLRKHYRAIVSDLITRSSVDPSHHYYPAWPCRHSHINYVFFVIILCNLCHSIAIFQLQRKILKFVKENGLFEDGACSRIVLVVNIAILTVRICDWSAPEHVRVAFVRVVFPLRFLSCTGLQNLSQVIERATGILWCRGKTKGYRGRLRVSREDKCLWHCAIRWQYLPVNFH